MAKNEKAIGYKKGHEQIPGYRPVKDNKAEYLDNKADDQDEMCDDDFSNVQESDEKPAKKKGY